MWTTHYLLLGLLGGAGSTPDAPVIVARIEVRQDNAALFAQQLNTPMPIDVDPYTSPLVRFRR